MAVNTTNITSGPYIGNGLSDEYSYDFRVTDKTQLRVFETTDAGARTELTVDTDYTVAGIGVDAGGIITRVAGNLPTDYIWYIRSDYDDTQKTAFGSQGGFFPDIHEDAMDKRTFVSQQQQDILNRTFRLSDEIDIDGDFVIGENAANRSGKYLTFDTDGDLQTSVAPQLLTVDGIYDSVALMKVDSLATGLLIQTRGYYTAGDGGGATYLIVAPQAFDGYGDHELANSNIAVLQNGNIIDVRAFGAKDDSGVYSVEIQAAINRMNQDEVPILVNNAFVATNIVSTGFTDISGSGSISQDNIAGRGLEVKLDTADAGNYTSASNVELPTGGIEVTKLAGTFTASVGDVVQVVDDAILSGTSNVNFAETATVQAVDGTGVWLDAKLRHLAYFTTGTLFIMSRDKVSVRGITLKGTSGAFSGSAVRLSALTIAGAIAPVVDITVSSDINAGVALRGCYKAQVNLIADQLRDDSAVGSSGYGVVTYGCCKNCEIHVNATKVRHAYTDGIWDSGDTDSWEKGFSIDTIVRGVGAACSAATWDTHPYSDGVIFDTVRAVEGSSSSAGDKNFAYAFQLRGTNARIINAQSDRDKAMFYDVGSSAIIDSMDIVEITETGENTSLATFSFTENISGNTIKVIGKNCKFKGAPFSSDTSNIDYAEFEDTEFDYEGDSWDDPTATKDYKFTFKNCVFKDFLNFRIRKGTWNFDGGKRIITDATAGINPISMYEGVRVKAVNFGAEAESFGFSALFLTGATITAATSLYHSGCYLENRSGSTTHNLIKTQGSAITVVDITATTVVP